MDPVLNQSSQSAEEDEWDKEGFVIPSLATAGDSNFSSWDEPNSRDHLNPPPKAAKEEEEKIYLGPHGAPPSQAKHQHQELGPAGRRQQRLRQKLREADAKKKQHGSAYGTGRENRVEAIRELVGGGGGGAPVSRSAMTNGSPRDWLDPHCLESAFESR